MQVILLIRTQFIYKEHAYLLVSRNIQGYCSDVLWQVNYWFCSNPSMMTSSNGKIFCVIGSLCGEFTGPDEFPTQRPVTRSFDVFFDLRLNKRLSKHPWGWWFETPSWSLWRHRNATLLYWHWSSTIAPVLVNQHCGIRLNHYDDVIMSAIASQITSLTIAYSTVYSGADQRKHQSSASLAFVWGIHRGPVNSPHKWPVTRKMFPFDDDIMRMLWTNNCCLEKIPATLNPTVWNVLRWTEKFIFDSIKTYGEGDVMTWCRQATRHYQNQHWPRPSTSNVSFSHELNLLTLNAFWNEAR